MRPIMKFVITGIASGTLASAVPARAQNAPCGYPYGSFSGPYSGGYAEPYSPGYGANTQIAVNRCADAVQARLEGAAYGGPYADGSGARVLGISSVYPLSYGGAVTVRGVAGGGRDAPYSYGRRTPVDLTWQCTADYRGLVVGLSIQPAAYGNESYRSAPYGTDDYSQYGYRRY